ncbi:PAS domain-containing protein [Paenibacillus rhizoplanae]
MDNLASNNSILDQTFQLSPVGMAVWSPEGGRWMKINPAFFAICWAVLRLSFSQGLYRGAGRVLQDEFSIQRIGTELAQQQGQPLQVDQRFSGRDGHPFWLSLTFIPAQEEPSGRTVIVYAQDVTDSRIADQLTVDSRDLYNLFIKDDQSMISFSLPDGTITFISPSSYSQIGYHPEEVIGRNRAEFYHLEDVEAVNSSGGLLKNDISIRRLRHKEGQYLWFETSFHMIRGEKGEITRIMGIGRNVTRRKHSEEALASAQRVARIGSWGWDLVKGRITFSEELRRILQYSVETGQVNQEAFLALVHPEDVRILQEAVERAKGLGEPGNTAYRMIFAGWGGPDGACAMGCHPGSGRPASPAVRHDAGYYRAYAYGGAAAGE